MNHIVDAAIVFACVFGSALLGSYLRRVLPQHHLSDESTSVVKLATGLVATMAALVLGLLISSAKGSFDTMNTELVHSAAAIVRLDRALAQYGPETQEIRGALKRTTAASVAAMSSGDPVQIAKLSSPEVVTRGEELQRQVEELSPRTDMQRQLQARALQIVDDVLATRWLALLQQTGSIPVPLLVVLVSWLAILFATFGLFAPRNGTTMTALVMCALSTSGAIFLIMEMNTPLGGIVEISFAPMRAALGILGH
ncbi:bestrophin-like domain [Paraburkholderia sp. RL17-337-BIB-A]|uniref:bestrophin-like domain n=1 Tax=Paraburkholderia sp. RL17-337-BIB-A TaxID=3031636 RepID=UPI0038B8D002